MFRWGLSHVTPAPGSGCSWFHVCRVCREHGLYLNVSDKVRFPMPLLTSVLAIALAQAGAFHGTTPTDCTRARMPLDRLRSRPCWPPSTHHRNRGVFVPVASFSGKPANMESCILFFPRPFRNVLATPLGHHARPFTVNESTLLTGHTQCFHIDSNATAPSFTRSRRLPSEVGVRGPTPAWNSRKKSSRRHTTAQNC